MEHTPPTPQPTRRLPALICSTAFLTFVPTTLYDVLILWSDDLGGPLNLLLIPGVSFITGFILSLVIYLPLSFLAEKFNSRIWRWSAGGLFAVLAVSAMCLYFLGGFVWHYNRGFALVAAIGAYVVGGFFAYLWGLHLAMSPKRLISAVLGLAILIPVLFFSSQVARGMYYDYVLFPRLKAEEHYIMPTRWQDFTFLAVFWMAALALLLFGLRLIRYSMNPHSKSENTIRS